MKTPKSINKLMLIYLLWEIIGVEILVTVGGVLILLIFPDISDSKYYVNLLLIQDTALMLLPILIFLKKFKDELHIMLPLKKLSMWNIIYCLFIGSLMIPIMSFISIVTSLFCPDTGAEVQDAILSSPFPVGFLVMGVLPALMEETVFRGFIFGGAKKFGVKYAAILSAFYFGLFHLNGYQIPYAMFAGLILALAVNTTGSLISSMIIHLVINGTQVIGSYYYSSLAETAAYQVTEAAEDYVITASDIALYGVIAAVFAVLLALTLKGFIRYNKGLSKEEAGFTQAADAEQNTLADMPEKPKFIDIYLIINTVMVLAYTALSTILVSYIS